MPDIDTAALRKAASDVRAAGAWTATVRGRITPDTLDAIADEIDRLRRALRDAHSSALVDIEVEDIRAVDAEAAVIRARALADELDPGVGFPADIVAYPTKAFVRRLRAALDGEKR